MLEHCNPPKRTSSSSALGDRPGALEKSTFERSTDRETGAIRYHLGLSGWGLKVHTGNTKKIYIYILWNENE